MGVIWDDDDDDDTTEEEAAVDNLLERWLAGEDVSLDEVWDAWDVKYQDEETYVKEDDA